MSKYEPLQRFLRSRKEREVPLSFEAIEDVLGFDLPRSARLYAPWWSNVGGTHVQASAWLDAGWRTSNVDVPGGRVVFVRDRNESSQPSAAVSGVAETGAPMERFTPAALRLLADYTAEAGGDQAAAIARAVHEAALARRNQLIDSARAGAPVVTGADSVDLIREDRDGR
jgi:hypothetical protein